MADRKYRILVVEDDETLCETLQFNLQLEGYDADVEASAEEAMGMRLAGYDLILLDVMMGRMSGFDFARLVRADAATRSVPIIFCTAKDSDEDMVAGLDIGADDYIAKPYSVRNVLARVRAVLRRTSDSGSASSGGRLRFLGVEIDPGRKICRVDGIEVKLVKKEFEILSLLMAHCGRVFSREEILGRVWSGDCMVNDRAVDVNITRIRQKIAPYGDRVVTRSGYGYGLLCD